MLARRYRLSGERAFTAIRRRGVAVHGATLTLRTLPTRLGNQRFAIAVSQKVSKHATRRNRLRRQISEILRIHRKECTKSFDGLITVLPPALSADFPTLERDVLTLLRRAHVR